MSSYLVTEVAQADIEEIVSTVADNNQEAAEVLEGRIYEAFDLLAEMPEIGHSREDLTSLPVLFWPIKQTSYAAIYKNASPIEIIRVVHWRRDIATLLQDENTA